MDGLSNSKGSGARVVSISLQGEETKLVMRLQFCESTNEVEYDVLLIGLWAAQNVGATWVLIHLDF